MIDSSKKYLQALLSGSLNDFKAFAYEAITVGGTLSKLTVPAGARYAQMILESTATGTAARILRNTSVAVTSTVGMPLSAGAVLDVNDYANLNGFQIIKDQSGTTLLHVEYFK